MYLYLVRHGKAEDAAEDTKRALSDKGHKQAKRMGHFMAANEVQVNAIWHSELLRAKQTATHIATALNAEDLLEERDDLAPMDHISSVERAIREHEGNLMIVGHLPFMGNLLSHLLTGQENSSLAQFDTACAACLIYARGASSLLWFVGPKQLD